MQATHPFIRLIPPLQSTEIPPLSGIFEFPRTAPDPLTNTASLENYSVERLDPLATRGGGESLWDCLVRQQPEASVFHSSAWARVLNKAYGHVPHYLRFYSSSSAADSASSNTQALIPLMDVRSPLTGRRGVSLPFSDFCSPLLIPNGSIPESHIYRHLRELASLCSWKHLELRGATPPPGASPTDSYYGHALDLTRGIDALKKGFSSSVCRAIRKGERSGLSIRVSHSRESLHAFLKLHLLTRQRHGLPPQPRRFFDAIYEEFISKKEGFIVVADQSGLDSPKTEQVSSFAAPAPVAAAVFLQFGSSAVYKFGASDERAWSCRPNNLVMSSAIRHLCDQGIHSLHLGRTDLDHQGLRQFKLGWGSTEHQIDYYRFESATHRWNCSPSHKGRLEPSKLQKAIFRYLPPRLNELGGALIYPHLD